MPEAAEVVVQPVARNEAGSHPAGDRLELAAADERANLVLGTAELSGNLAARASPWLKYRRAGHELA